MQTMGHRVFGHFDDAQSARAAYAQLRRGQMFRPKMSIHVRTPGKSHEEDPISMTDARRATVRGIVFSGIVGAVSLAILFSLGARWIGFSPTFAFLGALGGMAAGALAGFLQGSREALDDRALVGGRGHGGARRLTPWRRPCGGRDRPTSWSGCAAPSASGPSP